MIAIKDMETPKCCHWDCPLCNEDGGACMLGAYDTKIGCEGLIGLLRL